MKVGQDTSVVYFGIVYVMFCVRECVVICRTQMQCTPYKIALGTYNLKSQSNFVMHTSTTDGIILLIFHIFGHRYMALDFVSR